MSNKKLRTYNRKDNPRRKSRNQKASKQIRKNQNKKQLISEDNIKPHSILDIQNITMKQLKVLLSKQHFPTTGARKELIKRLLRPKYTVYNLKLQHHIETNTTHIPFTAENYIFTKGIIKLKRNKRKKKKDA